VRPASAGTIPPAGAGKRQRIDPDGAFDTSGETRFGPLWAGWPQSVVAEDRSNAGLTVIVLKTADQKSKLMRVVAPLGVLLPSGLGLKLDNQDVGRAGFVRCLPNGCVAEVVMDEKLLGQLRTAKTATFIIFETPEEGIGFPLSLNGLGEGYDKLP
jgi:invasion protein IalB